MPLFLRNWRLSIWLLVGCSFLLAPTHVMADTDGAYCTAPGYLAAEFRQFSTPEISSVHVLKIATFDEKLGPLWSGEVALEEFQTHTLICTATGGVTIEGVADRGRGLVTYEIKINGQGTPSIVSVKSDPKYVFRPKESPPNLALYAPSGTVPLKPASGMQRFQLRFVREEPRRQGQRTLHEKKTFLEQLDDRGNTVQSLVVFRGTFIESFGE